MAKEPDNKYAGGGTGGTAPSKAPKSYNLNSAPNSAPQPSFTIGRKGPNMFGSDGDGSERATAESYIDRKSRQAAGTDAAQASSFNNSKGKKNLLGARPGGTGSLPYLDE